MYWYYSAIPQSVNHEPSQLTVYIH